MVLNALYFMLINLCMRHHMLYNYIRLLHMHSTRTAYNKKNPPRLGSTKNIENGIKNIIKDT